MLMVTVPLLLGLLPSTTAIPELRSVPVRTLATRSSERFWTCWSPVAYFERRDKSFTMLA